MATQKTRRVSRRRGGREERARQKTKGRREARTKAAAKKPTKLRFAPSERVFHTMVPGGKRTTCCDQDVNKVYGVTVDPKLISDVTFCPKAVIS